MTPRPPRGIDDAAAAFGYRHTPTLRVSTAKGCHDYYWAPGSLRLGNGLGALRGKLDGDVRAGNAYVIGPGSVHATGVVYELADADQPPTPAPSWLLTALLAPTPQPALSSRPTPSGRGRGGGGLLGLIRFVLESREGQRNERLFWAACRAFEIAQGKRLDARAAADALTDAAVRVGLPDAEARKTITSAYRARQPVTGNTSDQAREILEQTGLSEEAKRRTLRITRASGIEPEPVVWAWTDEGEGRIPAGALTVAARREGTGKSSFGMWMAAHVTRGTLPGSFEGQPRAVFYVAIEDSWKQTIVPRLIAAGANLELVCRVEAVEAEYGETTLSLPQDNSLTEGAIGGHGVALVVLDPLMSCIGKGIDTHRERDVRTALDPLACMAGRTGAVLLGIAHFNKGSGTDPAALITGSGAFKNVPRAVFGFARDDDHDCRVMTQAKNSLGRIDLPSLSYTVTSAEVPTRLGIANVGRFTFTGRSARTVDEILAAGAQTDRGERDEAAEWLRGYLIDHGGQASGKDVKAAAAADDISARTLSGPCARQA